VSKHLRVLREVDLVRVRDAGRHRIYRLNGRPLQQIHDWLQRFWNQRLDALGTELARGKRERRLDGEKGTAS
jgi:DNA-binding transcriptional ArsR family regulator